MRGDGNGDGGCLGEGIDVIAKGRGEMETGVMVL